MLEFNIDKQAGIQLHTCERKSRWCKTFLLLSWLLLLPLLLGWLFWGGFLQLGSNNNNNKAQTVISSTETSRDCKNEVASSVEKSVKKSVKENKAKCDQQLTRLKSELTAEIDQLKNQAKRDIKKSVDNNEMSQQLISANQKLKLAKEALRNSEQEIKNIKVSSSQSVSDKELAKKLYFYEKILAVNGNKNALAIEHFAVKPQDKERHYRFQLLLTKLGKHQTTTGSYDIFLKGNKINTNTHTIKESDKSTSTSDKKIIKKQSVTYKHTGLSPSENVAKANTFSFNYYQDLQGEIVLPENFEVESFSVNINPKNLSSVRNSYEWKKVQNQPFKEVL